MTKRTYYESVVSSIRIPLWLKEELEIQASIQNRSLNKQIRHYLEISVRDNQEEKTNAET